MAKFITNPEIIMHGAVVLAVMQSLNYENYRHLVEPVLAEHGIEAIDPAAWYPSQLLLTIYKTMDAQDSAMFDFVAIGKKVAQNFEFPPEVTTLADAMNELNKNYGVMLQHYDEDELYEVEEISDNHIRIHDNNLYPHDMVYGYIHTLAYRFKIADSFPRVVRTYDNPANPNAGGAVYDITW